MFRDSTGAPYPGQPIGPGGADYKHQAVEFFDAAANADGYWLLATDPKAGFGGGGGVSTWLRCI